MPRIRTPTASRLLPCLDCRRAGGAKAREEIAVDYLNYVLGERRLRFDDDRRLPYLPRACCQQATKSDVDVGQVPEPVMVARIASQA